MLGHRTGSHRKFKERLGVKRTYEEKLFRPKRRKGQSRYGYVGYGPNSYVLEHMRSLQACADHNDTVDYEDKSEMLRQRKKIVERAHPKYNNNKNPVKWSLGPWRHRDNLSIIIYRTNEGWTWCLVASRNDVMLVKKYGRIPFHKTIHDFQWHKLNGDTSWLRTRQLHTFIMIINRLGLRTHVPKDILKIIFSYI